MAKNNRNPFTLTLRGHIWHAYISSRINGRRIIIRESTGCSSKEDATNWCINRLHSLTKSPDVTHEITLDAAAARWWLEVGQYQSQSQSREYVIALLLREMNKDIILSEITKNDIIRFVTLCRAKNRKPATINRYIDALSAISTRARDYWDCRTLSFKIGLFKQQEPKENIKYFTTDELTRIIDHAPEYLKPVIRAGLYTGIRKGRLLTLTWDKVDFQNNQIIFIGKNGQLQSTPIIPQLKEIMENLPKDNSLVFTNRGRPIMDIKDSWRRALSDAKVTYRSFHTLRHTLATMLLRDSKDLRLVKETLGHSTIQTTMKYAHLVNGRIQEGLNSLFGNKII